MQVSDQNDQSSSLSSSLPCPELSLDVIKRATNDFAKKNFVAKVQFGSVYRGKIDENSYCGEVAVKRLDKKSQDASLVLQKEIQVLTARRHTNIISLVGFCEEEDEKILVYEFMPNSSLYGYLFSRRKLAPRLTVEQRLEICLGVAKGLCYLHSGADLNIIHSEINTHNILLDASLVPKITGFEFAITSAGGTFSSPPITKNIHGKENLAPECYEPNYKLTQKADVYAFGLLLLEVLCERQFWNRLLVLGLPFIMRGELPKFTPKHVEEDIKPECARGCIELIRDCLEFHQEKRPDMNRVVSDLELALKLQMQPHDANTQNINLQPNTPQFSAVNKKCKTFPFIEIERATNDFAISNLLGKGASGDVYLGKISISGNNVEVAVKRMSSNFELGDQSFQQEKTLLSACNHPNIISLVGYCDEQDHPKILIYEYMPNGSLFDHIYNYTKKGTCRLTVEQRLEICLGVAEGLSYLHSGKDYNIIHCDLKPENILLDDNLVPKIADFGLSKTRAAGSAQVTKNIQGTDGYIAPECYEPNYKPSRKADVYAFGVILLEVICERPGWARIVNSALLFIFKGELPDFVPEHVKKNISPECSRACANLIKDCLEIDPNNRPSTNLVIAGLELALKLQKINPQDSQYNKSRANSQQIFSLSGIKTATNKFAPQNLIVETNFEKVYCGNISMDVAVKCKKRKIDQDTLLFQNEIDFLSACHHTDVISLVGYCDEPHDNVLVYEMVPNGSLYDRLHKKQDCSILLTMEQRLNICLGVAKGLHYLHSSTQSNTIRSYLNSESILLDGNLVPKISNFEFSRNCAEGISTSQQFRKYKKGMEWYLAPECDQFNYINVSKKADVYALGLLSLEVLCAMPNRNGRDSWARSVVLQGELQKLIPDHVMLEVSQECLQVCESLVKDCLKNDPNERLSINQVVDKLELALRVHMQEANYKLCGSI